MRRSVTKALVIGAVLLVIATYRQEHSSRCHLDSLREERRITTRVFGVPVWSTEQQPDDPYAGLYSQITGRPPDPNHWKQMSANFVGSHFVGSLLVGGVRCGESNVEFRERRELLAAVFQRYRSGGLQSEAAAQIRRIDDLLPPPANPQYNLDLARVDALRKELGLKPHLER